MIVLSKKARPMRLLGKIFVFVVLFFLTTQAAVVFAKKIEATQEEKQWIVKNQLVLGAPSDHAPFSFVGDNGQHVGIDADILALVRAKTGMAIEVVTGTTQELYDMLLAGKLDGITMRTRQETMYEGLKSSASYWTDENVVYVRTDSKIFVKSLESLAGKLVSVDMNNSHVLDSVYTIPSLVLVPGRTRSEALDLLANGQVDVLVESVSLVYEMQKKHIENLRVAYFLPFGKKQLVYGLSQDLSVPLGILNKGIKRITSSERRDIEKHWLETRVEKQTDWFKIGIAILVTVLVAAIIILAIVMVNRRLKREIQQRRDTEKQLVQAAKLASLGTMTAGIGHELNNPLQVIIFELMSLSDEVQEGEYDEHVLESLKEISSNADRMATIIERMRSITQKEAAVEYEDIDLHEVLDASLALLKGQLEKRGIALRLSIENSLPLIHADATQIEQVVVNMLINARDALENVESPELSISATYVVPNVAIVFRDNGVGIPQESMDKIFDPFFTTKSFDKGTGLGLSITHNIVVEHGGSIAVESRENEGSTFTVTLPALN